MSPFETAGLTVFIVILFLGLFSVIFGFPGTLLIFLDVFAYSWITEFEIIGVKIIAVVLVISLIAEAVDFALGAAGGGRSIGLSKKGLLATIAGAVVGAAVLTPPLMGLGTIVGVFFGGYAGLFAVDYLDDIRLKPSFRTGFRVLFTRSLGTLVKGSLAIIMIIITLSTIYS